MYVILKDYQTSTGFQLFKDDYVLKCVEHTFGLVGSNETSVTIPVFKEDRIIYNTFIGIPRYYRINSQNNHRFYVDSVSSCSTIVLLYFFLVVGQCSLQLNYMNQSFDILFSCVIKIFLFFID